MSRLELSDDSMCFACGKENEDGLGLEFAFDDGEVSTSVAFPKKFQGYRDVVHGGLLSTVLDEAMVTLLNKMGHLAVTAELRVRFLKPLPVGQEVEVRAKLLAKRGKVVEVAATAATAEGAEIAQAESRCILTGPIPE